MEKAVSTKIWNSDFAFENSPVPILANRNCPKIELPGLTIGPFEEGNGYDVRYWIAQKLVKSGIARLRREEMLDTTKLYKIQWKQRVQAARQVSKLPEQFYPKLRRHLVGLREEITKKPEKMSEYEKVRQVTKDIIISRLKKIVSLASAPAQSQHILKNLTGEEKFLYEEIHKLVSEWRTQILGNEGEEK